MIEPDPSSEFATSGAAIVSRVAVTIEEWAIGDEPSPGALLAAVLGELAQAAFTIAKVEGDVAAAETDEALMAAASGLFAGIAATALAGAVRIHPETRVHPPLLSHGPLLRGLDDEVAEWLEAQRAREDESDWFDSSPSYWLRTVTSLLTGAADGVAGLEGRSRRPFSDEDGDVPDDDPDPDEVATAIADSLYQASITAAAGAEWFADQFGELWPP